MSLADYLAGLPARTPPVWTPRPAVLLCANTVKPMHGVVPRLILGKEWWDRTRGDAYRSTDHHCLACGVHRYAALEHQHLEGHEAYAVDYAAGRQTYTETVPLCHYCHNYIHCGRLEALALAGQIPAEKYRAVLTHGDAVLARAKITRPAPYSGPMAAWGDWRLVLNGAEYPPVYKTYEDWLRAFGLLPPDE